MAVLVYVTTSTPEEAGRIGRALVESRLAACANVLGSVQSIYWWAGKVQAGDEAALILKTREDCVEALVARVKVLHSYEVPCVVALPVAGGNADFLEWVETEARPIGVEK